MNSVYFEIRKLRNILERFLPSVVTCPTHYSYTVFMFYCMESVYWITSSYRFRVKIAELSRFSYVLFLTKGNKVLHEIIYKSLDPLEFKSINCRLSFKSDVTCCVQWANVKVNICHLKNDPTGNDVSTGEGWGGGLLNKVLYGKVSPRDPTPYPFTYHFWGKRYPFHIHFMDK